MLTTEDRKAAFKRMAEKALLSQGASNLTGLVHGFSQAMTELRRLDPDMDTEYYNTHPISIMYATQIAHLTGCDSMGVYSAANMVCEELAKGNV